MPGQAATQNSMHICPMTTGTTPHVGGPVTKGENTVLIGGQPAATVGSICTCAAGAPDSVVQGVSTVLIGGKPAATMGDMTAHGGVIISGNATVLIGTNAGEVTEIEAVEKLETALDVPYFDLNI